MNAVKEEAKQDVQFMTAGTIDETNYVVFQVVDENAVYKKTGADYRWDYKPDSSLELPDYSGPFVNNLHFTDFSNEALINLIWLSYDYFALLMEARADAITTRKGEDAMHEIQTAAWEQINQMTPDIIKDWDGFPTDILPETGGTEVITFSPFKPDERYSKCDKERLVKLALGSQEFMNKAVGAWSGQIISRYGNDEMASILWELWSDKVLPQVRSFKIKWMNVDSGDCTPVEAFMKDLQIDPASFPGKAFEMTFEMPDRNTGICTFNKCIAVDQGEALGRPDILKKTCHSTCPASLIETAKMYDPNMKVEMLALPPRKSKEDVCCMYRLSMRAKDDPEYVVANK